MVNKTETRMARTERKRREPYSIAAIDKVTHDTWRLILAGVPLNFKPGQYVVLRRALEGEKPEPHPFSVSSSPSTRSLEITVKEVGDFTATIGGFAVGETVTLDGPFGKFSYAYHDTEHLVFIAGGIGVTPFISMMRDLAEKGFPQSVTLIWGNRTEQDIAYREEIDAFAAGSDRVRVLHVLSEQDDWDGEKGFVSLDLLKRTLEFHPGTQYFICGPPMMNDLVLQMLAKLDVEDDQLHTERFTRK